MRYKDLLEKHTNDFCKINNIPLSRGAVPVKYTAQLRGFIHRRMEQDRKFMRKKEGRDARVICNIVPNILKDFKVVESPIEEFMLNAFAVEGIGIYCRPQFEIGKHRVDFAFPVARLAVECDGKEYHFSDTLQIERDQKRDKYLAKKGWIVMHFDGLIIRRNMEVCIKKIKKHLDMFLQPKSVQRLWKTT